MHPVSIRRAVKYALIEESGIQLYRIHFIVQFCRGRGIRSNETPRSWATEGSYRVFIPQKSDTDQSDTDTDSDQ